MFACLKSHLEKGGFLPHTFKMVLKTNFHFHISDDSIDKIQYDAFEAIDYASNLGFKVLAFTCHRKFTDNNEYKNYAKRKGILLVSGIEATIEGKHTIVLNPNEDIENIKTFDELRRYKNENPEIFIIAPHPYVWSRKSLRKKLVENIDLFDAVELTVFSNWLFNFNKSAKKTARRYKKPLVATSDTHFLKYIKRGYALIDTKEKTAQSVFEAIRNNHVENKTTAMSLVTMAKFKTKMFIKLCQRSRC